MAGQLLVEGGQRENTQIDHAMPGKKMQNISEWP
jgi:hypothetical protein